MEKKDSRTGRDTAVPLRNPLIAAAVAAALGSTAAHAQDAGPALQEVVVTANRREENVLNIPYNISAISSKQIEAAGVTDVQGLTRMVPGLAAADLGPRVNSTNNNMIIRGLNASDQGFAYFGPNLTVPLVSTYLDEVPLFVNFHLNDIDRVEVLRGPQGTLYGSGAVGGTVRLLHHKPELNAFSWSVSTDVSGTEHSSGASRSFDGLVNVPLGDSVALRVSAGYSRINGFIDGLHAARFDKSGQPLLADPDNPLTSDYLYKQVNGVDEATSRYAHAALLWKASGNLEVLLDYTRQQDHSGGFSTQDVGLKYETNKLIPEETLDRIVDVGSVTVSVDAGFATLTSSSSYYNNRYNDVVDVSSTQGRARVLRSWSMGRRRAARGWSWKWRRR